MVCIGFCVGLFSDTFNFQRILLPKLKNMQVAKQQSSQSTSKKCYLQCASIYVLGALSYVYRTTSSMVQTFLSRPSDPPFATQPRWTYFLSVGPSAANAMWSLRLAAPGRRMGCLSRQLGEVKLQKPCWNTGVLYLWRHPRMLNSLKWPTLTYGIYSTPILVKLKWNDLKSPTQHIGSTPVPS